MSDNDAWVLDDISIPVLLPMTEEHLGQIMPVEIELFIDPWTPLAYALELRHNPNARYRVLLSAQNELIGYFGFWLNSSCADIVRIAVAPTWQGQGWGRFMVTAACKLAGKCGVSDMFLEVRASNDSARAFYSALGFEVMQTLEQYYTAPVEDAYLLHKNNKEEQ